YPPAQQVPGPNSGPPQPPATQGGGGRFWSCNAQGTWQTCQQNGYPCNSQYANAIGLGGNEQLARKAAEDQCNAQMNSQVSANFSYRASIVAGCRSTNCTPP